MTNTTCVAALDRQMLVVLTLGRAKCKMYPVEVEKIGGGGIPRSSAKKIVKRTNKDAMPSPSSDQRRCGYAWRRMFVRRSATRRPHMQFIKIIAIYIDYEDKNLALSGSSASGAEVSVSGR